MGDVSTVQGALSLKVNAERGRLSAKVRTAKGTFSLSAQEWAEPETEGTRRALLIARGGETWISPLKKVRCWAGSLEELWVRQNIVWWGHAYAWMTRVIRGHTMS